MAIQKSRGGYNHERNSEIAGTTSLSVFKTTKRTCHRRYLNTIEVDSFGSRVQALGIYQEAALYISERMNPSYLCLSHGMTKVMNHRALLVGGAALILD